VCITQPSLLRRRRVFQRATNLGVQMRGCYSSSMRAWWMTTLVAVLMTTHADARPRKSRSVSAADPQLYMRADENGDVVFVEEPEPGFARYRIGSFEAIALRQLGLPHEAIIPSNAAPSWAMDLAYEAGDRWGVDAALVLAVMAAESGFRKDAVSPVGARGLMQLMPATAKELGIRIDDPHDNVMGGARYLAFLLQHFGSEDLAIAAYNAGPGRVGRAGNRIPRIRETEQYVRIVTGLLDQYRR
jgi:hypothetical protein